MNNQKFGFDELVSIMDRLRSPAGCPWDREQTKESLRTYLVEEVYEILEAIDRGNPTSLKEELGDLFFHILFLSRISAENGDFDVRDVVDGIARKMIHRHPHVFGKKRVSSSEEVERNWSDLKEREKERESLLDGIPRRMPALLRAYRITERASRVGFDWKSVGDVFKKLDEETQELHRSLGEGHRGRTEDEMGDVLFVAVNIARMLGLNPEMALQKTTEKFIRRFRHIERSLEKSGRSLKEASLEEMDRLWDEAKKDAAS